MTQLKTCHWQHWQQQTAILYCSCTTTLATQYAVYKNKLCNISSSYFICMLSVYKVFHATLCEHGMLYVNFQPNVAISLQCLAIVIMCSLSVCDASVL